MLIVTILNIVLAVAVIYGMLHLHIWAIISSPRDPAPVRPVGIHPYARPHVPRHNVARPYHRPEQGDLVTG